VQLRGEVAATACIPAKSASAEAMLPRNSHNMYSQTLRSAMDRPAFRSAVLAAEADERVGGLPLAQLLESPVARLAVYRAHLDELVAASTPGTGPFAALTDARDNIGAIVHAAGGIPARIQLALARGGTPGTAPDGSRAPPPPTGAPPTLGAPGTAGFLSVSSSPVVPEHVSADDVKGLQTQVASLQGVAKELEETVAEHDRQLAAAHASAAAAEGATHAANAAWTGRAAPAPGASSAMVPGTKPPAGSADETALSEALSRLDSEERQLYNRLAASGNRGVFEAFLARKRELDDEDERLTAALEEHEQVLAEIRGRLANPPPAVLPSDATRASLYTAWKRALADREELLRQARARKRELMRDLKARHETQIVLLEMERRNALDSLRNAVTAEKEKAEELRSELEGLNSNITTARDAMGEFRKEFEQLRVALLIDRMAKSSQVANLSQRRRRLLQEAEAFRAEVEEAKARVTEEETAKWEAKLKAEKAAADKRIADERAAIDARLAAVRTALAQKYEAGFAPLLEEAEAKHATELQRVVELQKDLSEKERSLKEAHAEARQLSSKLSSEMRTSLGLDQPWDANLPSLHGAPGSATAGAAHTDAAADAAGAPDHVPDSKMREFEELKHAVTSMWETMDIAPEDVTAFLSEADLAAPYHPSVLDLYREMHRKLTETLEPPTDTGNVADSPLARGGSPGSSVGGRALPKDAVDSKAEHVAERGLGQETWAQHPRSTRGAPVPTAASPFPSTRPMPGTTSQPRRTEGAPASTARSLGSSASAPREAGSSFRGGAAQRSNRRAAPTSSAGQVLSGDLTKHYQQEMTRRALANLPPSSGGAGSRRQQPIPAGYNVARRDSQPGMPGRLNWYGKD